MSSKKYLNECPYQGMVIIVNCSVEGSFTDREIPLRLLDFHKDSNNFIAEPLEKEMFDRLGHIRVSNMLIDVNSEEREFIYDSSWSENNSDIELIDVLRIEESSCSSSSSCTRLTANSIVGIDTVTLLSVFSFVIPSRRRLEANTLARVTVDTLMDETISRYSSQLHSFSQSVVEDLLSSALRNVAIKGGTQQSDGLHSFSQLLVKDVLDSVMISRIRDSKKVPFYDYCVSSVQEERFPLPPISRNTINSSTIKLFAIELIDDVLDKGLDWIWSNSSRLSDKMKSMNLNEGDISHNIESTTDTINLTWESYLEMVEAENKEQVSAYNSILDISRKNNRLLNLIQIGLELANLTTEKIEKFSILPKIREYSGDADDKQSSNTTKIKRKRVTQNVRNI